MRTKVIAIAILITILFGSCYSRLPFRARVYIQKMTERNATDRVDKIVSKVHQEVDTVYSYSITFHEFSERTHTVGKQLTYYLIWYCKADTIYSFSVKPYQTKKRVPVAIKNIPMDDNIESYLRSSESEYRCFWETLDGEGFTVYIKGRKRLDGCIDTDCLFGRTYSVGSFPYQLQYHLSMLQIRRKHTDFENLYYIDNPVTE